MRLDEARRFALSLLGTTEVPVTADGRHLRIFADEAETAAAVATYRAACERLWSGRRLVGVRMRLAAARSRPVFELLEGAWRERAPRRLLAARDAGRVAAPRGPCRRVPRPRSPVPPRR